MSIDRSTTSRLNFKHRFVAAGVAFSAALVMTLSPYTLALASESTESGVLEGVEDSASSYDVAADRIEATNTSNAPQLERYAELQRQKAEEEAAEKAAEEAASFTYVEASLYGRGDGFMGGTTASGAKVTPTSMAVAMRTMPLGTVIEITYNGNTVQAVVDDRGPYVGNRQIDMQPAVADALGFTGTGTVGYRVVG